MSYLSTHHGSGQVAVACLGPTNHRDRGLVGRFRFWLWPVGSEGTVGSRSRSEGIGQAELNGLYSLAV